MDEYDLVLTDVVETFKGFPGEATLKRTEAGRYSLYYQHPDGGKREVLAQGRVRYSIGELLYHFSKAKALLAEKARTG